jgi:hypothetical protein
VIPPEELFLSQRFNTAILAGVNEKTGFARVGFGFGHDGSFDTVQSFLGRSPPFSSMQKDQLSTLLDEFDTGVAPSVGLRVTIDASNAGNPAATAVLDALVVEVGKGNVDVVGVGAVDGLPRSVWFDPRAGAFEFGRPGEGPLTPAQFVALAASARAAVTFMGVPIGSGPRIGIDRDDDGLPDGMEASHGASALDADSDDDGWSDGIEVARGSDPANAGSVPGSLSSPSIATLAPRTAVPWGLDQFVVTGSSIELGATLVVTDAASATTEYPLFPVGASEWSTHYSGSYGAEPLSVAIRNADGATSAPVAYP